MHIDFKRGDMVDMVVEVGVIVDVRYVGKTIELDVIFPRNIGQTEDFDSLVITPDNYNKFMIEDWRLVDYQELETAISRRRLQLERKLAACLELAKENQK